MTELRNVLVTGSRDWPAQARNIVYDALDKEIRTNGPFRLVHGGADGADERANRWWIRSGNRQGCTIWVETAQWWLPCDERCYHKPRTRKDGSHYCPMQGHYRNQRMVDGGADVCYAFPLEDSRGTRDCMKRAEKAGIRVVNLGWGGELCCPAIGYHHPKLHRGCFLR